MLRRVCQKILFCSGIAIILIGCANINRLPSVDLTQPGLTQKELDQYVSDLVRYTTPYQVQILSPEQLEGFKVAEKKLAEISEREGKTNGIGLASDYLSVIGEADDFFFFRFVPRLTQKKSVQDIIGRSPDWDDYYDDGEFQQLTIVLSKQDLSVECIALLIRDCPESVLVQAGIASN